MSLKIVLKVFSLVFVTTFVQCQTVEEMGIPCEEQKNECFIPLSSCESSLLKFELNEKLNSNLVWKKLIKQKKLSVALVDLKDLDNVKYADVNGNEMMYAASLPKIAILLAAMDGIEKGELEETKAVKRDMKLMIAKSDNQASTRMIDRLGYQKIADVMMDPQYMLYDKKRGGGLWVGKRYAAGGNKNPDPLKGLSHAATAQQVARFYYMLAFGQLVSEERSEQMLQIMIDPALHHKFVNTFEKIAPKAKLFRKSGSWSEFHSDSIMVWGPDRQYILVALVHDKNGEQIIRDLGVAVDQVINKA